MLLNPARIKRDIIRNCIGAKIPVYLLKALLIIPSAKRITRLGRISRLGHLAAVSNKLRRYRCATI